MEGDLLDIDALVLGIRDALSNTESRITQQQFQAAVGQVQQVARQRVSQKMKAVGDKNRRDGPAFMEKYKALEGVQSTASGMLYKVIIDMSASKTWDQGHSELCSCARTSRILKSLLPSSSSHGARTP